MSEPVPLVARCEGVRDRGADRRHAGLANAARGVRGRADYLDMDLRDFGEPQHAIVVEISFLDHAIHDIDLFVQTDADSVDDTAHDLSADVFRLDCSAAGHGAPDVKNADFPSLLDYLDLSDLGAMRAEPIRVRNSERRSCWPALPPRHFCYGLEDPLCPWFVAEKSQPHLKGIGSGGGRGPLGQAFG